MNARSCWEALTNTRAGKAAVIVSAWTVLATGSLTGCTTKGTAGEDECSSGEQTECTCPGGEKGHRSCGEDGAWASACEGCAGTVSSGVSTSGTATSGTTTSLASSAMGSGGSSTSIVGVSSSSSGQRSSSAGGSSSAAHSSSAGTSGSAGQSSSSSTSGTSTSMGPPPTFPHVSVQPGGLAYYDTPYFANAMYMGGHWLRVVNNNWGDGIAIWNNPQFNAHGYPKYLGAGEKLRGILYGLHVDNHRANLARGHVVLTWKGDADIRLSGGATYLQNESSGAETGRLVDGKRVYRYPANEQLAYLMVEAINESNPITEIKVWLADPADPENRSLENQLFHPVFLQRMRDEAWGVSRFMDWVDTNANPQQDWTDRRLPSHATMTGVLNPRAPATGFEGNRGTGVAYEYVVALCNEVGLDLWLNVPHMATDDFVTKLARLVHYGSDGTNPYDGPVNNPVFAPLRSDLKVYVEYSNEIWSWGNAFAQGHWANDEATRLGISKPQFNARRFSEVWSIFQQVFGGTDRVVRVAAVFTGQEGYTRDFLQEMKAYGPTLTPPVEPDVISPTTYFGNGIQDYVYDQEWLNGVAEIHPYWSSQEHEDHVNTTFDEWTRRMLSGDAQEGAGPDATGVGGGFDEWLHQMALTMFASPKPIVAYEGGPSIYTNEIEDADPTKGRLVTRFMSAMNRHARMRDVYRIHLNMAHSHGLVTHAPFVLVSPWGRYGQWGHLEFLDQDPASAVKYQFIRDWVDEAAAMRYVDEPHGAVPSFTTEHNLAPALVGTAYSAEVAVTGGDGAKQVEVIGQYLAPGLSWEPVAGDSNRIRVTGTPTADVLSHLYVRATDANGDPAFRTFTIRAFGGPGTLVQCDFTGTNPARNLPWTKTYALSPGITWSGWQKGAGIRVQDGDNALHYAVDAPQDEDQSTLALAITDEEYWSGSVTPVSGTLNLRRALVRFTVRRIDYHAPRRYAVMTSVGGFTAGAEVFASEHNSETSETEYQFTLPDTAAYSALSGLVELRIYGFGGQWGGHKTSITAFKLATAAK